MSISKRGPQSVLVAAILLLMLSSLRCTAMPSARGQRRHPCRNASCTSVYLSVSTEQNNEYDSLVSVYRNGIVNVTTRQLEENPNSLLRFQTAVTKSASSKNGDEKLFIYIYNKRAKRYICFTPRGKLRTLRKLPRHRGRFRHRHRGRHRRLTCRFQERMEKVSYNQEVSQSHRNASNNQRHNATMYSYVADERHRRNKEERFISFCRKRVPTRCRKRPAIGKSCQPRLWRPAVKPRRRQNRRRCQFVFMKELREK